GYTGPITRNCVESITGAVVVSMLSRRLLVLKEFRKGLELYGLADIVSKYPEVAKSLFVIGEQKPVDANYLLSVLKPVYSPPGTSRRSKEEDIMDYFQDFIVSLEDEKICVSGVMWWLTGQKHQEKGLSMTVRFDHCCKERNPKHTVCYPLVGACGKEVTFPVAHMLTSESFKDILLTGYCKGQSFSRA
ncbi:predicted protein, partial [Nematostella vectensis]